MDSSYYLKAAVSRVIFGRARRLFTRAEAFHKRNYIFIRRSEGTRSTSRRCGSWKLNLLASGLLTPSVTTATCSHHCGLVCTKMEHHQQTMPGSIEIPLEQSPLEFQRREDSTDTTRPHEGQLLIEKPLYFALISELLSAVWRLLICILCSTEKRKVTLKREILILKASWKEKTQFHSERLWIFWFWLKCACRYSTFPGEFSWFRFQGPNRSPVRFLLLELLYLNSSVRCAVSVKKMNAKFVWADRCTGRFEAKYVAEVHRSFFSSLFNFVSLAFFTFTYMQRTASYRGQTSAVIYGWQFKREWKKHASADTMAHQSISLQFRVGCEAHVGRISQCSGRHWYPYRLLRR